MSTALMTGLLGLSVLVVSAYLEVNNKDGSGWAFVALLLIMTSCSAA